MKVSGDELPQIDPTLEDGRVIQSLPEPDFSFPQSTSRYSGIISHFYPLELSNGLYFRLSKDIFSSSWCRKLYKTCIIDLLCEPFPTLIGV